MVPRTRRVQRVHLAQPLLARLGSAQVLLVDISVLGARVEHHVPLPAGSYATFSFLWDDDQIATHCRIVRSRLERFSAGADGLTVYHSGLEFENMPAETRARLKAMIGRFIGSALEEQKLNARGVLPEHDVDRMPIFRFGGQLTSNAKDKETVAPAFLPVSRVAKETGYICYALEHNQWRRKRTHDPGQPLEGFTIAASEEQTQAQLLCDAYAAADRDGRRLIQLCAQLSIVDGEGRSAARFEP
jgi:PilZ domain